MDSVNKKRLGDIWASDNSFVKVTCHRAGQRGISGSHGGVIEIAVSWNDAVLTGVQVQYKLFGQAWCLSPNWIIIHTIIINKLILIKIIVAITSLSTLILEALLFNL